ncbi:hypothetical protein OG250_26240 [Streptomyces sp. NBC_00487]|uniref:hypothetical protein n=1 Tax=unclassified Streptomyces TaxID=2593676 RepID=UPI002E173C6C|nr:MULTISPECIES: hypothetical protein [unclassified Streptomyces]
MRTVGVETILAPVVEGGGAISDDTLTVLLNHIDQAHLEQSLGQRVTDLLNADGYVQMHTVRAGQLRAPTEDFLTDSC